jgi:8-oxo-dGTP diphosphatase
MDANLKSTKKPAPKARAVAVLIENGRVAMIERRRASGDYLVIPLYYVFPGGGVKKDETPEQAVIREVLEELGLQVRVRQLVAESTYRGHRQLYYLVERTGGEFGAGYGKELSRTAHSERGSVIPVWLAVNQLAQVDENSLVVYPARMAELVIQATETGWPDDVVRFEEL